jgi:hypothetical protein
LWLTLVCSGAAQYCQRHRYQWCYTASEHP